MRRVTKAELPAVRAMLLAKQGGRCASCGEKLRPTGDAAAVDHDHRFGFIRGVLCRRCNTAEGRIKSAANRCGWTNEEIPTLLGNLSKYLAANATNHTGMLHPEFKTEVEQKAKRAAAARKRRAAVKKTAIKPIKL